MNRSPSLTSIIGIVKDIALHVVAKDSNIGSGIEIPIHWGHGQPPCYLVYWYLGVWAVDRDSVGDLSLAVVLDVP